MYLVDRFVAFTITILCLLLVAVLVGAVMDLVQVHRSFDATVACEARQMVARRKTFESTVVCVPSLRRQDTTTVNLNKP